MNHIKLFESFDKEEEQIVITQDVKDRLRTLSQYLNSRDLWDLTIDGENYHRKDQGWDTDWPIYFIFSKDDPNKVKGVYINFNRTPENLSASGGMYSDTNPHIYLTKDTKPHEVEEDKYISAENNPFGRAGSGTIHKGTYLQGPGSYYINHVIARACGADPEFKRLLWDLIASIQNILPY